MQCHQGFSCAAAADRAAPPHDSSLRPAYHRWHSQDYEGHLERLKALKDGQQRWTGTTDSSEPLVCAFRLTHAGAPTACRPHSWPPQAIACCFLRRWHHSIWHRVHEGLACNSWCVPQAWSYRHLRSVSPKGQWLAEVRQKEVQRENERLAAKVRHRRDLEQHLAQAFARAPHAPSVASTCFSYQRTTHTELALAFVACSLRR